MSEINLFVEKYRPKTIDECVLPLSLKKTMAQKDDPSVFRSLVRYWPFQG